MHAGEPGAMQRRIKRFLNERVLLDSKVLEACLRDVIGEFTFQVAHSHSSLMET